MKTKTKEQQIFLDCDGVLANFDDLAIHILEAHPRQYEIDHGEEAFWRKLREHGSFYRDMGVLPGGRILFEAVRHLHPIILTGCPQGGWAEQQKAEWAHEHFPGTQVITCASKDKYLHMKNRGDILVDDYDRYRDIWIEAGGNFVLYKNPAQALKELANLGVDIVPPPHPGALFSRSSSNNTPVADVAAV